MYSNIFIIKYECGDEREGEEYFGARSDGADLTTDPNLTADPLIGVISFVDRSYLTPLRVIYTTFYLFRTRRTYCSQG